MNEQLRLFADYPPTGRGFVYFARRLGAIKIGYSCDVARRMVELGATLLASIPGTLATEAGLHRRFRQYRIAYEWFGPAPELLDFIDRLNITHDIVEAALAA